MLLPFRGQSRFTLSGRPFLPPSESLETQGFSSRGLETHPPFGVSDGEGMTSPSSERFPFIKDEAFEGFDVKEQIRKEL